MGIAKSQKQKVGANNSKLIRAIEGTKIRVADEQLVFNRVVVQVGLLLDCKKSFGMYETDHNDEVVYTRNASGNEEPQRTAQWAALGKVLFESFGNYTIEEVEMAAQLYIEGRLFIKGSKYNDGQLSEYKTMSAELIGKLINAYAEYKRNHPDFRNYTPESHQLVDKKAEYRKERKEILEVDNQLDIAIKQQQVYAKEGYGLTYVRGALVFKLLQKCGIIAADHDIDRFRKQAKEKVSTEIKQTMSTSSQVGDIKRMGSMLSAMDGNGWVETWQAQSDALAELYQQWSKQGFNLQEEILQSDYVKRLSARLVELENLLKG